MKLKLIADFMRYLLETSEANSRFVFLLQGITTALAVLIVTIQFVRVETSPEGFVMMVATLLGGGAAIHMGRSMTKKVGNGKKD